MARSIESKLTSRNYRIDKLTPRGAPWDFTTVDAGVALGYRKITGTSVDGRWVVRAADGKGSTWQKVLGVADDYQDADGINVLNFTQAAAAARRLVRGNADNGDASPGDKPVTIGEALLAYQAQMNDRRNATRVLKHLPTWLANMPVANATEPDFIKFTTLMAGKGLATSSIKRTCTTFAAALVQAARTDKRISNARDWKDGLAYKGKGGAATKRNHIEDSQILALIAELNAHDSALGLLAETAAQTGSRPSQIARLEIANLKWKANEEDGEPEPFLVMSASYKGTDKDATVTKNLPIERELGERLRKAAHGRSLTAPLLLQSDGQPWISMVAGVETVSQSYQKPFKAIADRLGLGSFSFYGFRHCSIIRQLRASVPPAIVADAHDSSVAIIEKHYGSYITDLSDKLIRRALLNTSQPITGKVVKLHG